MKNRFDQVVEDRNEVLKDMEEMKRKYEVELSEVREDFRKEKAEREHLRVRNTLLQDMSKIIVDKCLKPDKPATKPSNVPDSDDVHVEDIVLNKNRGYRRVSPVDIPAKENESNRNRINHRDQNLDSRRFEDDKSRDRVQYCHFYNNSGRCFFEERFGKQCKFAHKVAPICNFDRQCSRPKCMFRHTLPAEDFLEERNHRSQPWFPTGWNQRSSFQKPWIQAGKGNQQQN